jgi:hypothetical protein
MNDDATWITGRRRTARAAAHVATGVLIATIAWGFLVGVARRACKCEVPEPPTRLLEHGGWIALGLLGGIAVLTWVSWRSRPGRARLATVGSMVAMIGVLGAWLQAGTQAPDAAARHAQLATVLLGGLLFVRIALDAVLDGMQAAAPARGEALPIGNVHRDG